MSCVWHRYGFLGKKIKDLFGHFGGPVLSGLVGLRRPRDHGVPYSLTEEFVSVYRMHSLLPDKLILRDIHSTASEYECPPVVEEYCLSLFFLHMLNYIIRSFRHCLVENF
jgi:hypothetical protein